MLWSRCAMSPAWAQAFDHLTPPTPGSDGTACHSLEEVAHWGQPMESYSLPSASYSVRTGGSHIPAAILLPTVAFYHDAPQ